MMMKGGFGLTGSLLRAHDVGGRLLRLGHLGAAHAVALLLQIDNGSASPSPPRQERTEDTNLSGKLLLVSLAGLVALVATSHRVRVIRLSGLVRKLQ